MKCYIYTTKTRNHYIVKYNKKWRYGFATIKDVEDVGEDFLDLAQGKYGTERDSLEKLLIYMQTIYSADDISFEMFTEWDDGKEVEEQPYEIENSLATLLNIIRSRK